MTPLVDPALVDPETALLAATVYVLGKALGLDNWPAALVAIACGFALRAGALVWGWSLPGFPGAQSRS